MGSKKVKTTSNETATTTPNVPSWAQQPVQNYFSTVGQFQNTPFSQWMPTQNNNLTAAFGMSGQLGNNNKNQGYSTASLIAQGVNNQLMNRPTLTVETTDPFSPYDVAQVQAPQKYSPQNVAGPTSYKATNVADVASPNFMAATLADLGGWQNYAAKAGQIGDVQGAGGATAAQFMDLYKNPATAALVDATLANYDKSSGKAKADYEAKALLNGGFGGSGYAIGNAELLGNIERERAMTEAELRNQAWLNALDAAKSDSGLATQASIANANNSSAQAIAQAQMNTQANIFNAGTGKDFALSKFNAANDMSKFNAGQWNDLSSLIYGTQNQNAQQNAAAQNAAAANSFNAQVANAQQNAAAQNNAYQNFYNTNNANAQQNAAAQNAANANFFNTAWDQQKFNTGSINDFALANAQLNQNALAQQLQAAGLLGDLQSARNDSARADANTLLDLGQAEWNMQNQTSPLAQLLIQQGLIDPSLYSPFVGQTINTSGTSTSKQSGGLLGDILGGMFGLGAAAIGKGK